MRPLVPIDFANNMIGRNEKTGRTPTKREEPLITIPGFGSKTKMEHAKTAGVTWDTWYQRHLKWKDGKISTAKLMEPKCSPQESGRRSLKSQRDPNE